MENFKSLGKKLVESKKENKILEKNPVNIEKWFLYSAILKRRERPGSN